MAANTDVYAINCVYFFINPLLHKQFLNNIMKKLITIALFLLSINTLATSYEVVGYSNKGHYEQMFGCALINDICDIHIEVGEDTYNIKYAPETSRNRIDGKIESRGTCNKIDCYIAVNKGTLEIIEVRFKDGELIRFYVK